MRRRKASDTGGRHHFNSTEVHLWRWHSIHHSCFFYPASIKICILWGLCLSPVFIPVYSSYTMAQCTVFICILNWLYSMWLTNPIVFILFFTFIFSSVSSQSHGEERGVIAHGDSQQLSTVGHHAGHGGGRHHRCGLSEEVWHTGEKVSVLTMKPLPASVIRTLSSQLPLSQGGERFTMSSIGLSWLIELGGVGLCMWCRGWLPGTMLLRIAATHSWYHVDTGLADQVGHVCSQRYRSALKGTGLLSKAQVCSQRHRSAAWQ